MAGSGEVPPTPTGTRERCPFFSAGGNGATTPDAAAVCPAPVALRGWQHLKFGLFLHWGAYSQLGIE